MNDQEFLENYDNLTKVVDPRPPVFYKITRPDTSQPQPQPSDEQFLKEYDQATATSFKPPMEEPDTTWKGALKQQLKPSPAAETAAHLGYGLATWIPSKLSGLGQIGFQKLNNAIFGSEAKNIKRTSEEREMFRKGVYSPEKIREMAEQSEALWQILPPPESKEAKFVLEKVGEGLDWALTHFRVADEYYTKKGYPNLGYALRFAGELLFFKAVHGFGVRTSAKLKKLRRKVTKKAPAVEVEKTLEEVFDEIGVPKEEVAPKGDELKGATKSQKIGAHKLARKLGLNEAQRRALAEEITGTGTMMEMSKQSAGKFIEELKKRLEKPKEVEPKAVEPVPPIVEEKIVEPIVEKPPVEEPKPSVDTPESLAEEFDLRYMGEMGDLKLYSMKVPKGETTVATKGVSREALVKRMDEVKEQFKVEEVKKEVAEPVVEKPPSEIEIGGGKPPTKDIVVANIGTDEKIYYGRLGELHYNLSNRYPDVVFKDIGFTDSSGKFLTRTEALEKADIKIPEGFEKYVEREGLEAMVYLRAKAIEEGMDPITGRPPVKPEPPSDAVKTLISDDIRTAEDMGIYAEVKEMLGKKKKIGEIMKEVKQKAYYKEDLADFGYVEKDIREAIRAIKAEMGDEGAIKQIQTILKKEKKKVEKITEAEEIEPPVDVERVDPLTGRPAGVKEDLISVPKEVDEIRMKWEQEQIPIIREDGSIAKSKFVAMKRAKELGRTGDLVKNPKGDGWLVKKTKEQRETKAEEDAKEWEAILKEEELGDLGDEGLGERVDVDIDHLWNERGSIVLKDERVKAYRGERYPWNPKLGHAAASEGVGLYITKDIDFARFFGEIKKVVYNRPKKPIKINDNDLLPSIHEPDRVLKPIKETDSEWIKLEKEAVRNLKEQGVLTEKDVLGRIRTDLYSAEINTELTKLLRREGYDAVEVYSKSWNTGWTVILDEKLIDKAATEVKIHPFADIFKGEKGAITFHRKTVKELKRIVKKGYYTRNRIIRELRKRGASDEDILKVFPDASVRILNKGKESKWWKEGQDPLELLPRRTLPNKLKAPAITRGEAHMIATMKDMPARLTAEHLSWENAIRTFEKLPKEMKETFYRTVDEGVSLAFDHLRDILKRSKKIRNSVMYISHKRIGIHAIAQQSDGVAVLAQQGITKIPKLKPKELKAYEDLRIIYDELFPLINKARIAAGEKPFPKMENYFTWIQDLHWLQKTHGIGLFSNWRTIESKMAEIKRVPGFRFAKFRAGSERPRKLHLNPFAVVDVYAKTATHYIEMAPRLAKLNELLTEKYEMTQNAPHAYNFIRHWLNFQAGKIPAWDIAHPITRRAMQVLNSNVVYSLLAFNIRSALIQPAALASSYAVLGEYYMGVGLAQVMSPSKWKMAGKKSNKLNTRTPEVALYEAMESGGRIPGLIQRRIGQAGLLPLTVLDSVAARITWLGAYEMGLKKFKLSERNAINYADDIVTKTQASAARSDIAPIQRTQLGKTVTCLQTFVINHWGFLTKDVMGIKNADIKNPVIVKRVIRFILATTAMNALYEDVLGLNSPNPTPIRAYREMFEETADHKKAFARGVKEIAEYIPLWGGRLRYGSEIGGPVLSELLKLIEKGDIDALIKLMGIPGSNQFFKMVRAHERGGTDIDTALGRYVEPDKDKIKSSIVPIEP